MPRRTSSFRGCSRSSSTGRRGAGRPLHGRCRSVRLGQVEVVVRLGEDPDVGGFGDKARSAKRVSRRTQCVSDVPGVNSQRRHVDACRIRTWRSGSPAGAGSSSPPSSPSTSATSSTDRTVSPGPHAPEPPIGCGYRLRRAAARARCSAFEMAPLADPEDLGRGLLGQAAGRRAWLRAPSVRAGTRTGRGGRGRTRISGRRPRRPRP